MLFVFFPGQTKSMLINPNRAHTHTSNIVKYFYLEPQTTIIKRLFQLDDSKSLHRKWLFHQTSTLNWLFGVPGTTFLGPWDWCELMGLLTPPNCSI